MALAMCSMAFAQDNIQRQGHRPDPAQMAQRMTDMMAQRYGLDDTQKASLLKVNTEYAGKMPMMRRPHHGPRPGMQGGRPGAMRQDSAQAQRPRPSREEMEKRFKEMRANQEAYNAEVKKILTDEQYTKFTEDQQRHGRPGQQGNSEKQNDTK